MTTPPLTNPLLDQLAQAQQQTLAPPRIPPPTAPMAAPPTITAPSMGTGQLPQIPSPTPPNVTRIPTQTDVDKTEQARKINTGSGISQIMGKVEGAMPNHPLVGKLLGGAAQGLATLGDVGLRTVAPAVDLALPGTSLHHLADLHQGNKQIAADEAAQTAEATQGEQHALTGEHTAQTNEIPITRQREDARESSEEGFRGEQVKNLQSEEKERDTNAANPTLAAGYSHAVNQAIKEGRDPAQDPIVQHLSDAIVSLQPEANKTQTGDHVNVIGPNGKPMIATFHPDTGKTTDSTGKEILNPQPYEKPTSVSVNTGEKSWEYANNQLNTLGKPVSDLGLRMGRLKDTLAQGTPQADALVAPELLTIMAGGQGSGMRMNEAEIARIVGGRSHWETLKAAAQKWAIDPSSANSITSDQRQQIRALVQTVDAKLQQKQSIVNDAATQMVNIEDPKEQHRILAETRQKLQGIDAGTQGGTNAPAVGTVEGGYRFKGGDAGKQENWEKVSK